MQGTKLNETNIGQVKVDDVLYNWKTHEYCRVKYPYLSCNQRITVGQLSDTDSVWWTSYISLRRINEWRLCSNFDEGN